MKTAPGTHVQKSMEHRRAEIGRRIDDLLAKAGDVIGPRGAVAKELDVWRRWRDELHVQAQLASMDARDALEPRLERVDRAYGHVLDRVDELRAGVDFEADDDTAFVEKEMKGLRGEFEAAAADFRIA